MAFDPLQLVYKFTSGDIEPKENYKNSGMCKLMMAYHAKRKLTSDEQKLEDMYFSEISHYEAYHHGIIRLMGWAFNFGPLFKTFLVKHKYNGWLEIKAPGKKFVRRHAASKSHIVRIIELEPAQI